MNREITYKRSRRSKNLYIKIKPFSDVIVSMPFFMLKSTAEDFVDKKSSWIQKKLLEIKQIEQSHNKSLNGFKTRYSTVTFKGTSASRVSFRILKNEISVFVPKNLNEKDVQVHKCAIRAINKSLMMESELILPKRVEEISQKYNLLYNSLTIKYTKTRWGSCSGKNDIILNPHLLRLPDELLDYVILHELTHTKVKNHSKKFWSTIKSLDANAKKLDKELKQYSLQYF